MRRVVSLFLPTWPTDRIRRQTGAPPVDEPLVTARVEGSRRIIAAVDKTALALGLRPGLGMAHAQALVPGLRIVDAAPEADDEALTRLARWCSRYAPIVAPNPPDGIWIDIAGAAHLLGGEEALLADLVGRLEHRGIAARAAVADAPGTAWAVARYGAEPVVPPGRSVDVISRLPIQALRLPAKTIQALVRLGIERVGELAAKPRAPMTRRFGTEVALRLDQALGHAFEPINPLVPHETPSKRMVFAEPVGDLDDLKRALAQLAAALCVDLAREGTGVRRLDLIFRRVDRKSEALRIGTAQPSRDAAHLAKLFDERLQTVDPGFGIDEAVLIASRVEPLGEVQGAVRGIDAADPPPDLGPLVDRLAARVGAKGVYRLAPVESHTPERSTKRIAALAPPCGLTWPETLPRPTRLLDPPEEVVATALLPDHPPRLFVWRRVRHRIVKADGPERVTGDWWRSDRFRSGTRDYYRVENEHGTRFWLFRDAPADQGGKWWLHGLLP